MILSDYDIRRGVMEDGFIYISPYKDTNVQPSSVDLRLGPEMRKVSEWPADGGYLDLTEKIDDITVPVEPDREGCFYIRPGEFWLGHTLEVIGLPRDLGATVEGKSSLARVGLLVHVTAGYIDPGFKGQITLELYNLSNRPMRIGKEMKIAQLAFFMTSTPVESMYGAVSLGSRYQNQRGATPSRLNQEK